ncbi:helix-turn-helix domain-containing protein [Alicyclobacillus tolerans]|uniref:helix-turn-helix domain-containing protein n=1 Tax=Alicyclobacillus tolerans TaxID=90970 RepID=UPI003B7F4982
MAEQDRVRKGWTSNFFQTPNGIYEMPISACAKAVYIFLCRCADREGQSFPSYKTIGEAIGWGRTKVAEALKELETIGLLIRQEQYKENGARDSNLYTITHPDDVAILGDNHPRPSDGLPQSVKRTTPVHQANYPHPQDERAPSVKRTQTIHNKQNSLKKTYRTTHTTWNNEIAVTLTSETTNYDEQINVCKELQNILQEKGINAQLKTIKAWLQIANSDDVLYAADLATQDSVRNPAGFIGSLLRNGIVKVNKKEKRDPRYEAFYKLMEGN